MDTTIWAPTPLRVLGNRTGFVQCDAALADELVKQDKVQRANIGARFLRPIRKEQVERDTKDMAAGAPAEYQTKVMLAKPKKAKR